MSVQTDREIERKAKKLVESIRRAYEANDIHGFVVVDRRFPLSAILLAIATFNASGGNNQNVFARYRYEGNKSKITLYRNPTSVKDVYPETK